MAVHPDIDVLQAWSTGRLPDAAARLIEMHLTACNTCGDTLEGLPDARALFERIRGLRGLPQAAAEPAGTWLARLKQNRPGAADLDEILRRAHLGQYPMLAKCGAGGMGAVYRATHPIMQREVAIKVLPRRFALDQLAYDRFLREVQLLARLDHPHIVRAYDAGIDAGIPYLVMEHVPGKNCDEYVRQRGPLPVSTVCLLLEQLASALQYAHEQRFVHRDIKPSNLLLNPDATHVKLSDLGLARAGEAALGDSTVSGLTAEGLVMGTPDYLAPEQWQDARSADIRADLYGLGCTAYFLLTAQVPFPGSGDYREKMALHGRGGATPLERLRSEIPTELAAVIRKLMAPRREDRYQTPAELSEALRNLASHRETITRRPPPVTLTGRPVLWAAAAMAGLVLLFVVATQFRGSHRDPRPVRSESAAASEQKVAAAPVAPVDEGPLENDADTSDTVPVPTKPENIPLPSTFPQLDARMTALLDGKEEEVADDGMEEDLEGRTPTLTKTFRGHTGEVTWVAFAPDSLSFASASFDRTVRVWSPGEDEPRAVLRHPHQVTCVAFAPQGNSLASCTDEEGAVRLWNITSREAMVLGTHKGPWSMLRCVAFRDDGGLIASGSMAVVSQSSVMLWDPSRKKSGATLGPAGDRAYGGVYGLAFCPHTKLLAVGYDVPQAAGVRLWDTASREELDFLAGPSIVVAFSPNGKRLIAAQGQDAVLWSVDPQKKRAIKDANFQLAAVPFGFPRFACSAAFAPDNRTLAISYHDGTVALWNADTSHQLAEFKAHAVPRSHVIHYRECSVAFAPDGKTLLTGGFDHQVKLWKLPSAKQEPDQQTQDE